MFYLVLIYTSVKLTFITQKYVIFLLAVLGHHSVLTMQGFLSLAFKDCATPTPLR